MGEFEIVGVTVCLLTYFGAVGSCATGLFAHFLKFNQERNFFSSLPSAIFKPTEESREKFPGFCKPVLDLEQRVRH
jgi:hypothetical protein